MGASPRTPRLHFSHDASVCHECWLINELFISNVFLLLFDRNKRSNPLCTHDYFTSAVTWNKVTKILFVILSDNQTAFQYTLPRIIISHQTSLSNTFLRILHCNEICPLSLNIPPPHPWLRPPPIRGRTHRKLLLASPVNQTASWKRINFPRYTFSL